jgi:hypothetical protein
MGVGFVKVKIEDSDTVYKPCRELQEACIELERGLV